MKRTKFIWVGPPIVVLSLVVAVAFSAEPVHTTSELLEMGHENFHRGSYKYAALYLYAYTQRNPALMKSDPEHAAQVEAAIKYCLRQSGGGAKGDDFGGYTPTQMPKPNLPKPPQVPPERTTDLTGTWKSEHDTTYYIRQVGNTVCWYAESHDGGATWAHVFHGTRLGNLLEGMWADIPKGKFRNSGALELKVENIGRLRRVNGGFSDSVWTRLTRTHRAPPARERQ